MQTQRLQKIDFLTGKMERKKGFQTHESSDSHMEEVVRYVTAPGTVKGDIGDLLSEHALENSKNRKILLSILSNIRYLARQAFPLRGDRGLRRSPIFISC